MTWTFPELIQRLVSVLPDGMAVETRVPEGQTGWVSIPVFGYAKHTNQSVALVAQDIVKRVEALGDVQAIVAGGFVNVTPKNELVSQAITEALDERFGSSELGNGKTIVIDFSQPNIAKRMHIGHLRSTVIGDALCRTYRSLGYQVVGINYIGDWGTQYGKLMVAYFDKYGDYQPRDSVTIQELFELYVQYHVDAEEHSEMDEKARAAFKQLEDGDQAMYVLWRFFVDLSLREFQKFYDRLHIEFTEPAMGESFHAKQCENVSEIIRQKGNVETSDGAEIVRIDGIDAPLILRKSDGATTYATRDLAALKYRSETYQPEKILYVVSNEQALHFEQVFAVAEMTGLISELIKPEHVKFGFLRLPDGKMSTRAGRVIFLEDVLDEAVSRAREFLDQRESTIPAEQRADIAEVVGVGALKYFDLSHDRKHDIVFDWDRMLSLKGDSAPYLMYSYTRAKSILRKANATEIPTVAVPEDLALYVRTLARFPLVLANVVNDNAPHILAQYLNVVATNFHSFYERFPVLKSEGDEQAARLAIVAGTANVLKRGLNLLGIDVLEEM